MHIFTKPLRHGLKVTHVQFFERVTVSFLSPRLVAIAKAKKQNVSYYLPIARETTHRFA